MANPEQYPDTYVFKSIKHKRLSPEQEAEARKEADEYFRKQGVLGPELKPHEKLELEEQAKASSSNLEILMNDIRRRCGVPIPFPLEDIFYYTDDTGGPPDGVYDHDDPEYLEKLSIAACGAINDYRRFWYKPGLYCNKEQLKIATEVALDIRAERPDLRNIPFAENPDCPTDEDFIQLGQWFLDANTVIEAEIRKYRESIAEPTVSDATRGKRRKRIKEPSREAIRAYQLRMATGWTQEVCAEIMTRELKPKKRFEQYQICRLEEEAREWLKANNLDVFPAEMTTNILTMDPKKLEIGARMDGKITGDPRHTKKKVKDPDSGFDD